MDDEDDEVGWDNMGLRGKQERGPRDVHVSWASVGFFLCFCPAANNDGPGSPMLDDDTHGTRPLQYEQLLVGRMAGASDDDDDDSEGQEHWVGGQQQ